jgi:hypothetical protein
MPAPASFRARRVRLLALVTSLLALAIDTATAQPRAAGAAPVFSLPAYTTDLIELGFAQGVALRGTVDEQSVFFPVPQGLVVDAGELRLDFAAVIPGYRHASLALSINERPVAARRLLDAEPGSGGFAVSLAPGDLAQPFIKVTAKLKGVVGDDRCFDDRAAAGHVWLKPGSGVTFTFPPGQRLTLHAAWTMLPRDVEILLLPGGDIARTLETALAIGLRLDRRGRQVSYRMFDEHDEPSGDRPSIIVGPASTLAAAASGPGSPLARRLGIAQRVELAPGNAALASSDERPVLLVAATSRGDLARFLAGQFGPIALGATLAVEQLSEPGDAHHRLVFERLGVPTQERAVVERGVWDVGFAMTQLPLGRVPTAIAIDLAVTPPIGQQPNLLFAYANDTLVHTTRLRDHGAPQRVTIPLPDRIARLNNTLRIMVQREAISTACGSARAAVPAQLLGSSFISTRAQNGPPGGFAELALALDKRTEIAISAAAAAQPRRTLALLTAIGRSLMRDDAPGSLRILAPGESFAPSAPFLLVGAAEGRELKAPVRIDRGRVRIVGSGDRTVLDLSAAHELRVVQLATNGTHHGLWVIDEDPARPAPARLDLDRGNVSFIDAKRTLMSMHSRDDQILSIVTDSDVAWFEYLGGLRYYLLGAAWLGLTVLVVGVLRHLFRQRTGHA